MIFFRIVLSCIFSYIFAYLPLAVIGGITISSSLAVSNVF